MSEVAFLGLPVPPGLCLNPTDLTSAPEHEQAELTVALALHEWLGHSDASKVRARIDLSSR